jgi:hypothetical protein
MGIRKFKKDVDPASKVVEKALLAAGWVRLNNRTAYEVPPGLVWPLPGGEFGCRILGVPSARLVEVGIPDDQAGLAGILSANPHLLKVLRDRLSYRIGGSWHFAEAKQPGFSGTNLQRLATRTFLEAAAKPWSTIRAHLEAGSAMQIEITNTERQEVTPTGRPKSISVEDSWAQLVEAPVTHWTTGMAYGDRYADVGPSGSVLVRAVLTGRKRPRHQIILSPLGVALAAGLRGRVNHQAGSAIHHDAPIQELVGIVRDLPEPARRLLLHVLCATTPENPADGPCSYLEDPGLLVTLLGSKIQNMTEDNWKDLKKRRAHAALEVTEAVASSRLEGVVRRRLQPLLAKKVVAPQEGKGRIPKSPGFTGWAKTQEITPTTHDASTNFSRQDTGVFTERHLQTDAKTPEVGGESTLVKIVKFIFNRVISSLRTKNFNKNMKTLTAPVIATQTPSSRGWWWPLHGEPVPSDVRNPGKSKKRLQEKDSQGEQDETTDQGQLETTDPSGEHHPGEPGENHDPDLIRNRSDDQGISPCGWDKPDHSVTDAEPEHPEPLVDRSESSLPMPVMLIQGDPGASTSSGDQSTGDGAPVRGMDTATHVPEESPATPSIGFQPRQGVRYCPPGSCKPTGLRYELPMGSERDVPADDTAELGQFLLDHPDLIGRFPSELLHRVLAYLPMSDRHPISARQLVLLLSTEGATNLTRDHLEDLLRVIDTAPDDLILGPSKPQHLALAIGTEMVRDCWLNWHRGTRELKDWTSFLGRDPYRVAAGRSWRHKADPGIRSIEAAARAFADWWVLVNVELRIEDSSKAGREVQPLVRLADALRGAGGPSNCGWAIAQLTNRSGYQPTGTPVERYWRHMAIDPAEILGSPFIPDGGTCTVQKKEGKAC